MVIFAAKEAVEKRAMEKGPEGGPSRGPSGGSSRGQQAERKLIENILEGHGVELPPEVAKMIACESGQNS